MLFRVTLDSSSFRVGGRGCVGLFRLSFRAQPAKGGGRGIFVYKPWHATAGQGDCGIYLLTTASGKGFVGRYLRPLGLSACGGRKPGGLLSKPSSQRRMPSNKDNPNRAATDTNRSAPGAGAPTGDFWERSGQHEPRRVPGHGAPSSKSSSKRRRPVNEAVPTRITPDTNQSAPGAGPPTGDFWKRSGQHEPRRVPGRGAPLIGVVFRWAHTFQRSRLSSGTGFQRSRPHQNDTRQEPKRTGSGYPHRRFLEAKRTA